MKAAITYTPPRLHSFQNVPSPVTKTTNIRRTTTARAAAASSREAQVDIDSGVGISIGAHFSYSDAKILCEDFNTNINIYQSGANDIGNSCCQREHKNYGKHAMLKCPSNAAAQRVLSNSNDSNERSSKKCRERHKAHHPVLAYDTVKAAITTAITATTTAATIKAATIAAASPTQQPTARLRSTYATITTAKTETFEGTTKSSTEKEDNDAFTSKNCETLYEVKDMLSATTFAATSSSTCEPSRFHSHAHNDSHNHTHSHSHLHSQSHSQSQSSHSHSHSITLKTQSCLADSLRLRNRRQLVMPIVENSSLGITVSMQQQQQQQQQEQQHEEEQQQKTATEYGPIKKYDTAGFASASALTSSLATATVAQMVGRITENRTATMEVGCVVGTEARLLNEVAAISVDNSQTTTKLTTTKITEIESFDCRCFKENGDICITAAETSTEEERCALLATVDNCDTLCQNVVESTAAIATTTKTKLLPTLQRLNSLPTASVTVIATNSSANSPSPTPMLKATLRLKQWPTITLLLRKRLLALDTASAPVWWRAKTLLLVLLMLMLTSTANCWAGRQDVPSNCTFPSQWQGSWFLSGYQQSIHIKGSQFSYRGRCAASDGNKYLIVDEKGCHRCLVIYEKHKNVLQYKESECEGDSMYMHQTNPSAMAMRSVLKQNDHRGGAHPNLNSNNGHSRLSSSDQYIMRSNDDMNDCPPDFCKGRETLQNLCDQIPGDALLYSLFRESAEPVKCPLKGPFIFTYNRGHGECKSPVSNIESCTEDSRLLLSFQACPDVQGTESTVEELTCLATWKDGNSRYLVGLVSHHHAISNEERYRCFVYEKISSLLGGPTLLSTKDAEYKLAQSGDATCNGLDSAEVGSRIMSLRKPPLTERCDFPTWFKGPRHWHVLMGNAVYNYHPNDGSVHIIKPNGFMETRALCEQINKQTSTEMMAVVHYTTGCQSGFMCMMFYRRDTHVIEIQTGKQASRLEDACAPDHFDVNRMPYITLLASNPDPQICPMEGLYNLRGAIGPPYSTTRHKRNHNNKVHMAHNHHHAQSEAGANVGGGSGGSSSSTSSSSSSNSNSGNGNSGYAHKRHTSLSIRNADKVEKGSWHANTRGLPVRSRRATASIGSADSSGQERVVAVETHINLLDEKQKSLQNNVIVIPVEGSRGMDTVASNNTITSVGFIKSASIDDIHQQQRNRRDVPGCVTNYKAQRRLWVGCTEPDIIDVRPMCNDNGDEEFSCHGSWTENGTVYIIARHTGTKHGVCISYRPTEGTAAKLVIGDACYRGTQKPPEHHLVANLTVFGKCGETGSDSASVRASNWLVVIMAVATSVVFMTKWHLNAAMSKIDAPVIISR